jgi:CBS domain-containing protein
MVSEVMTRDVRFVSPQESVQRAAQMMDDLNVGALPVCDGERLVGMVTDRDITVRATSAGMAPTDARVEDVMSGDVRWCFEDQSVDEVMQQMADTQIRRVPVVSHDNAHKLVGIVALGDLAAKTADDVEKQGVGQAMEKVSSPSEPDRSQQTGSASTAGGMGGTGVHKAPSANKAPDKGTSAGQGSTHSIGTAAGTTLGAAATGAGNAANAGDTGHTNAPARGIADAAGGPSTPASARAADTEGTARSTDATRSTGAADGGTDAAGASGASGGTAGTAGSGGTGAGPRP